MTPKNPPSRKDRQIKNKPTSVVQLQHSLEWTGPLPPPQILEQYNAAMPDGAERVFKMAEAERDHRHKRDMILIDERKRQGKWGQVIASVTVLAILIVAYLINSPWSMIGSVFGIVTIVCVLLKKRS